MDKAKEILQGYASEVLPNDPRLPGVYRSYQANLEDMCQAAIGANAQVILCTVGANIRHWRPAVGPQLRSLSEEETKAWKANLQDGMAEEERGSYQKAADAYTKAEAIDDSFADLAFRLGTCLWQLQQFDRARDHFLRALELDGFCWVRAKAAINEAVTATAAKFASDGVYLADSRRYLEEQSPHRTPGIEFFIDSCHLTFDGSYVVACKVFDQVVPLLPEWIRRHGGANPSERLSAEECKRMLGLTPQMVAGVLRQLVDHDTRLGKEPLAIVREYIANLDKQDNHVAPAERISEWRRTLDRLGRDFPARREYCSQILEQGDLAVAEREARQFVAEFPYRAPCHDVLAQILVRSNKIDEAIIEFRAALDRYPDYGRALLGLGQALLTQGRLDEVFSVCRQGLALKPGDVALQCLRGDALARKDDVQAAIKAYQEAIAANPESSMLFTNLDALLRQHRDLQGRAEQWRAITTESPDAYRAWICLGMAEQERQNSDAALACYRQAAACPRCANQARMREIETLVQQGKADAAIELCQQALIDNEAVP
jgi:tetratricopeptide (TPR) repeat protein